MDNFEYFVKTDLSKFVGNWVAILNNKIIASGKNFKEVAEKADKAFPNQKPLFTKVPKKTARIL